jgi:excinuclease UvrABC helicase subunit UvrB
MAEEEQPRRRVRARVNDAGRVHHIGTAPELMPVLRPDGTAGTTRTSLIQLRHRTDLQLTSLADLLVTEMGAAAAALDYEQAAHLRDELANVRAEQARRQA